MTEQSTGAASSPESDGTLHEEGATTVREADVIRALQRADPDAVACGLSAARLWNLPLPLYLSSWDVADPDSTITMSLTGFHRLDTKQVTWRSSDISSRERTRLRGIGTTTRLRTFLELAEVLPQDDLVAIGDHLVRMPRPGPRGPQPASCPDRRALRRRRSVPGPRVTPAAVRYGGCPRRRGLAPGDAPPPRAPSVRSARARAEHDDPSGRAMARGAGHVVAAVEGLPRIRREAPPHPDAAGEGHPVRGATTARGMDRARGLRGRHGSWRSAGHRASEVRAAQARPHGMSAPRAGRTA